MNTKTSIDNLAQAIEDSLMDFVGVTEEACESGVIETADYAVKELRSAHPAGSGQYHSWDKYNKGWTKRKQKMRGRKGLEAIVYNKDHYRLTHLLEKGHAKVNGGRTRAFPHIAPVEEKCEEKLVENIRKHI